MDYWRPIFCTLTTRLSGHAFTFKTPFWPLCFQGEPVTRFFTSRFEALEIFVPSPQLGVRALRLTDTWRRDELGTIVRNTGYFCAGGDRGGPWWPEGDWNGGVQLLEGDFHGHDCNTRHKSWNTCVIIPFPNVDLGITVVSLLQNTRGSTLGKDRGKLKWERRCQEWM